MITVERVAELLAEAKQRAAKGEVPLGLNVGLAYQVDPVLQFFTPIPKEARKAAIETAEDEAVCGMFLELLLHESVHSDEVTKLKAENVRLREQLAAEHSFDTFGDFLTRKD